jgi:hypothetical protein
MCKENMVKELQELNRHNTTTMGEEIHRLRNLLFDRPTRVEFELLEEQNKRLRKFLNSLGWSDENIDKELADGDVP